MIARLFIILVAPIVLIVAFFHELIKGMARALRSACAEVGIEFACVKRDWVAKSLGGGN